VPGKVKVTLSLEARRNKMSQRQVSRSGDNGKSTPVPVVDLGGHYEDHRPDPADLSAARAAAPVDFKAMRNIKTADWIENLMDSGTVFSSPKGSFKLNAAGFHGSVQPIPDEIRQDPYVLRAVQRGRIAFLTEEDAMTKIAGLRDESSTSESHLERLRDSLNAGASDNNGMYKIPLPDEAEPKGPSQSWEQVWDNSTSTAKPKNV
jgi:hypothetical protein